MAAGDVSNSSKEEEQVLVVPRSLFDELGAFQGIHLDEPEKYLHKFLQPQNNKFLARGLAEEDPSWKQLIPYALLVHEGRVLHYKRGKGSGESRLATKGSLGIGGHMNPRDTGFLNVDEKGYLAGFSRELDEELTVNSPFENTMAGLLNDDSNEVGRVHLGIIHILRLERPEVAPREDDIVEPRFLTPEEIRQEPGELETWSRLCLDNLDKLLAAGRGS
jgi:predicted NUDIX family phosphoesterase